MVTTRDKRTKTINLRITEAQFELLDRAANLLGKSRSELMIDATMREAQTALLDQVYFQLDPDAFEALERILDDPAPPSDRLRELFVSKMPWE